MRRREFISGATGAAIWPLAARAQQAVKVWRVGILDSAPRELNGPNLDAFLKRLHVLGYVEGRNLTFEYRSTAGRDERLPDLVSELIYWKPDVMVVRGTPEVLAVKNATSTVPVVMSAVADPVGIGVAASLSRPGGNITGMSPAVIELETKRIESLKEIIPGVKRIAFMADFRNSAVVRTWDEVQKAA